VLEKSVLLLLLLEISIYGNLPTAQPAVLKSGIANTVDATYDYMLVYKNMYTCCRNIQYFMCIL